MEFDTTCNTGLGLGIQTETSDHHQHQQKKKKLCLRYDHLLPSLTLGLSDDTIMLPEPGTNIGGAAGDNNLQQLGSSLSALSSFCNSVRVKKEVRENYGNNIDEDEEGDEEEEFERVSNSRVSDEDEDGGGGNNTPRKKLRLTKEQSAVLEESFKEHSTLNPKQKHALAERLNLRPRQVEVWFQNRRARTKLKQTEVDCEFLKRCCETLTEENKRLQKELQELKSFHKTVPFYLQQPAAALAICPSCQRIATAGHDGGSSKSTFSFGPRPYFFNPFSHPSAASC